MDFAFDRLTDPGGSFFVVQSRPIGWAAEQLLRVLSRLNSDAFPRAVEWQEQRHQIDVALTWTHGISLAEYPQNIRDGSRPPVEPAQPLRLVNGPAHAVCHLQRRLHVNHGDIQPANVIVTSAPSRLQRIDFGSAWISDWTTRRTEGDGHHRGYAAPGFKPALPRSVRPVIISPCRCCCLNCSTATSHGGLGGKAGRPGFIAHAIDTQVSHSQILSRWKQLPRSLRDRLDALACRSPRMTAIRITMPGATTGGRRPVGFASLQNCRQSKTC